MRATLEARKALSTAVALLSVAVIATGSVRAAGRDDSSRVTAAGTADRGQGNEAAFVRLDADDDGRVSREEARAMPELHREWEGVDLNKDGYVSLQEFSGYIARTETKAGKAAKR